jgi:hypothetical protein
MTVYYDYVRHTNFSDHSRTAWGLRAPGGYQISYECRTVYIGVMGLTIEECKKEHQRALWLYHLEHLAASDHSVNEGHWILSEDAVSVAKLPHCTLDLSRKL